jgi:hypothetical protein
MNAIHLDTPAYIYGFLALLIPFLLLLSKAKTSQTNDFSSVEFLRNITEKASNQMEWKKLLLLLIRLLLLGFLILAFCLPFLRKTKGSFFWHSNEKLIILIDHSMSMSYLQKDAGSLLDQAKRAAKEKIKVSAKAYQSVAVYSFDRGLRQEGYLEKKQEDIESKINQISQSDLLSENKSMEADLIKIFNEDKHAFYEVWLFSDFQNFEEEHSNPMAQRISDLGYNVDLQYYPIQPSEYKNFALQEIKFSNRPFITGMKQPMDVFLKSIGYPKGYNVDIELKVDGHRYHQQKVEISESGEGSSRFWIQMPAAGDYRIEINALLPEDPLLADNRQHAVIKVNEPMKVLLIQEKEYDYPFENPYYFFSQALKSQGDHEGYDSWIEVMTASMTELSKMDLAKYQMIVLANLIAFDARALSDLRYYLKGGGNLFFSVGDNFDPKIYQAQSQLSKLLGGYFSLDNTVTDRTKAFYLNPIDYEHPSLRIFDYGKLGDLSQIPFYQIAKFNPVQTENDFHTLAWFNHDWPALVEIREGMGKTFVFMSSLNTEWNSFPKSPLYLPWITELLKYALVGTDSYPLTYEPGDSLPMNFDVIKEETRVQLKLPSGEEVALYDLQLKGSSEQRVTSSSGFYEWILKNKNYQERRIVAYNPSILESRPNNIAIDKPNEKNMDATGSSQEVNKIFQKQYFYTPLFYVVFWLLVIEAWVANRFYKSHFKKVFVKT